MHISHIDIAIIIVYLLLTLGVGVYQARKIKSSGDYYAGGRKFNKFYLMMHALGTASHADEPVSVIGGAYEKGLSGIWYTYLYLPLTPIFWLIAPFVRRSRFVTMADFFRTRYDENLGTLYSVVGVLKMAVAMSVVLKGTEQIFTSLTGNVIDPRWAILAMTVIFVIYGFAGGLRATVVTETIQGPLIVVMSIALLPFGLYAVGGFKGLHAALAHRPEMFNLTASGFEFTPGWIFAASLTALIGWVAQPGIVAAVGSGKTELEGRVGYTYGTMIKRFCALGWVFTGVVLAGLAVRGDLPAEQVNDLAQHRELAFGIGMQRLLPVGVLGIMFAAIFAAQMATLSAQMVNSSALASRNLYKGLFRPQATDREVLLFGRFSGLFLVVLGVLLAFALERVATALTMLLSFQSIMGVIVWSGVLWRRANATGAWAAFVTMVVIWLLLGPIGMILHPQSRAPRPVIATTTISATSPAVAKATSSTEPPPAWIPTRIGQYGSEKYLAQLMVWALPAGVLAMIIGSLARRRPVPKKVDDFFMLLKTPVGQEQKLIDAGVNMIYVGSSTPSPLESKYPRLVHWGGFLLAAAICGLILLLLMLLAWIGS
ncbi:MAG TPA: sodium:solute symporter family protein [Tepidisphaeraceae bacterium]|jgi:Na+/proline symporter|nr:sodium:solute symporter family protein [Tepidisphaeraceae bacterium]